MSVYVVNEGVIDCLVKAFEIYDVYYTSENYTPSSSIIINLNKQRNEIGQSLLNCNIDAYNARYNENNEYPEYKYRDVKVNPGQILDSIAEYSYQCSSLLGFENSKLRYTLDTLKMRMLRRFIAQAGYKVDNTGVYR